MNLLILGGTVFLGRHLVTTALARGHTVTLFNRGQHNPDLFPDVEKLRGDRDDDLAALEGRRWDAVIDTCGYVPRIVRASAALLADAVDHYTFISSMSVYADPMPTHANESAPLATIEDETVEAITGETYGPLKALCEAAAEAAMPGRVLNIRPGLIVGPFDPSDRFTYWPVRLARGGEVLVPDRPDMPVQLIDARDLAAWNIRMIERGGTGTYNATGPAERLTFKSVLETCRSIAETDTTFTWVSEDFLQEHEVAPWVGLPLWLTAEAGGMLQANINRALEDRLTFRPLAETARDTLTWANSRPNDHEWRAGLTPGREAELLGQWHARP